MSIKRYLWLSIDEPEKLKKFPTGFAYTLLLIPLGLSLYISWNLFQELFVDFRWQTVNAIVTESRLSTELKGGSFVSTAIIRYKYQVAGKPYEGLFESSFGESGYVNGIRTYGPEIVRNHPFGSLIQIRVDPNHVASSRLVGQEYILYSFFTLLIFAVLVYFSIFVIQTARKKRALFVKPMS